MHSYFANKVSNFLYSARGAAATDSFARAQIDRDQDQEDHSARAHLLKQKAAVP